MQVIVDS